MQHFRTTSPPTPLPAARGRPLAEGNSAGQPKSGDRARKTPASPLPTARGRAFAKNNSGAQPKSGDRARKTPPAPLPATRGRPFANGNSRGQPESGDRTRNIPPAPLPAARGRPFAKGNSGRKPGSKNRATVVAAALLEGEEEELVRKAIDMAKSGDPVMLKFLLGRILPRERAIKLDLPAMNFADDAVAVLGAIFDAVTKGRITASEGAALASLIDTYARTIDMADLVTRLDLLEAKINGGGR
jgi:hypothetical protein